MSDRYEDIVGSFEKPLGKLVRRSPPGATYRHESEEQTSLRRGKCLEAIFGCFPQARLEREFEVEVSVEEKGVPVKIIFWPGSNTYFIPSKEKYGHGIAEFCERLKKWMK